MISDEIFCIISSKSLFHFVFFFTLARGGPLWSCGSRAPGTHNVNPALHLYMNGMAFKFTYFRLKLKVENTIRWHYGFNEDESVIKESNARFVKWSDGSMTLHVGSEIFDVYKQSFVVSTCVVYTLSSIIRVD